MTLTPGPAAVAAQKEWPEEWHDVWQDRHRVQQVSNLIFGTFHVSHVADLDNVMESLGKSPLHVIVVILENAESAVAEQLYQATFSGDLQGKRIAAISSNVLLVVDQARVSGHYVLTTVDDGTGSISYFAFRMQSCKTAVAVGVVNIPPSSQSVPAWLMQEMNTAVAENGVQVLTGVFGLTAGQISQWVGTAPVATSKPLAQGWQVGSTAVAAFPCYTLLFGIKNQETLVLQDHLLPVERAIEEQWIPGRCDWHQSMPQWWQWSHDKAWWHPAGHLQWGHVKQKAVDPRRWQAGVHQVVFWCGPAVQGSGARQKQHERWREHQRKQQQHPAAVAASADEAPGASSSSAAGAAAAAVAVKQEEGAAAAAVAFETQDSAGPATAKETAEAHAAEAAVAEP